MASEAFVDLAEQSVQTCTRIFSWATHRWERGLEGIGGPEREVSHAIKEITIEVKYQAIDNKKSKSMKYGNQEGNLESLTLSIVEVLAFSKGDS